MGRHRRHDRRARRSHHESHAGSHDRDSESQGGIPGVDSCGGQIEQPQSHEGKSRRDESPVAESLGQGRRKRRERPGREREGERPDAGRERAVAVHELEVLGEDEETAEQGEEGHCDRARRGRERPGGEDAQIDERVLDPELPPDEDRECRQTHGRFGERLEPGPAAGRGFDDGVDDRYERAADQHRADGVERASPRLRRLGHDPEHAGEGNRDDRDVHEEHAAPPEVGKEEAAESRADDDPDTGHCRPCRDRLRPLTRREDCIQDRERRGHDESGAEAHQDSIGDQHAGTRGEGSGQAAEGEDAETADERQATAVAVAERPGRDQ